MTDTRTPTTSTTFTMDFGQKRLASAVEQQLQCPICLLKLRSPRVLECMHTFCEECIGNVAKLSGNEGEKEKMSCFSRPQILSKTINCLPSPTMESSTTLTVLTWDSLVVENAGLLP